MAIAPTTNCSVRCWRRWVALHRDYRFRHKCPEQRRSSERGSQVEGKCMEKPRAASFKRRKCFARPRGWERLRRQGSKSIILELRVAGTSMPRTTDFVVIAALAIGVLGCGGVASREPSKGIDVTRFGGRWALDRQASDDVPARLVPLFERNEPQWRRNTLHFDEPLPRE